MNTEKIVFMNIATTDYSLDAEILTLSIVNIHNEVLYDFGFSSSRKITNVWRNVELRRTNIPFYFEIEEIVSILKDKIVIAYSVDFIMSLLKRKVGYMKSENYKLLDKIKTICLMKISAYIFNEFYHHNVDPIRWTYTHISLSYQRLCRVVNFYKIDSYVRKFLYHDYVCNKDPLHDTFVLTHIFSKILSYDKDDDFAQLNAKNILLKELKECGVIS